MTADEAKKFLERADVILPRWQSEIDRLSGEARDEAASARDSILGTLMEIAEEFPDKRREIDEIAKRHRYGVWAAIL